MSITKPFGSANYLAIMANGGSEPPIQIFAVMDGNSFVVGFPTRAQAEGYLKADKRLLTIREGTFPPALRSPSPYIQEILDKLGAGLPGITIDNQFLAEKNAYRLSNNTGLSFDVPKHVVEGMH